MYRIIFVLLIITCLNFTSGQDTDVLKEGSIKSEKVPNGDQSSNHVDTAPNIHGADKNGEEKVAPVAPNISVSIPSNKTHERSHKKFTTVPEMDSSTLKRLVLVLVALSVLFIMYLAFKTYRKRNRKHLMVSKYGVRTRRSDLEMRPLPLEEDEEDETVFDVGNVSNH